MRNIIKMGQNSNPTGGENEPAFGKSLDSLLNVDQDTFNHLASTYDPNVKPIGVTDGPGAEGITVEATDSIFNPFYLFRYAKYGNVAGASKGYSTEYHRDVNPISQNSNSAVQKDTVTLINENKKFINNPTASQIIEWAANDADRKTANTLGPTPYQWNDFLWCKWYGRIPNNRLLTLRRYPIPVEDNLLIASEKMPLVPIAQAVTWWGGETENSLDNILGLSYGFNWTPKTAEVTDANGTEISVDALNGSLGIENKTLRQFLNAALGGSDNPYAATGLDKKLQDWVKESYTKGPYWNRVLGPINVINKTQIRDTGYTFTHQIKLKFSYALRSFNNINPKIAMLDLITNFLALTYNKAEFWGGSIRYFKQTGLLLPGLPQADFEKGDYITGIKETLKALLQRAQEQAKDVSTLIGKVVAKEESIDAALANVESSQIARNIAGSWVKDLIQGPIAMRAILDGRAVGEWHLTVGNPIDPIAVIGNLCLKTTTIKFSEALGLDDFPTEVSFTVTLEPGRARAKQDIESMFNAGGGDMSFTPLPLPSSAYNSYGERNSIVANSLRAGNNADPNAKDAYTGSNKSVTSNQSGAENIANYFRTNVTKAYGSKFAASPVLDDYFLQLKTKD